jgi:hypothetical protein
MNPDHHYVDLVVDRCYFSHFHFRREENVRLLDYFEIDVVQGVSGVLLQLQERYPQLDFGLEQGLVAERS